MNKIKSEKGLVMPDRLFQHERQDSSKNITMEVLQEAWADTQQKHVLTKDNQAHRLYQYQHQPDPRDKTEACKHSK